MKGLIKLNVFIIVDIMCEYLGCQIRFENVKTCEKMFINAATNRYGVFKTKK